MDYKKHKERLHDIEIGKYRKVDNSAPVTSKRGVQLKKWSLYIRKAEVKRIKLENFKVSSRLESLYERTSVLGGASPGPTSMNYVVRKRWLNKISRENSWINERLLNQKPSLQLKEIFKTKSAKSAVFKSLI